MSFDVAEPRCSERSCKHLQGVREVIDGDESSQVVVCPAYPNGIPDRIAYGKDLHLSVESDQVGMVVYERN